MPPAPFVIAWSNVANAWSLFRKQRSFSAAITVCRAILLVTLQLLCLLFRTVISALVVIAPAILGGILGYFCFFHGSSGTGMFFKALLSAEISATNAAAKTLLAFGVSSLVSVAFIAWRRRSDFIDLLRAAWLWMWRGRIEETPGLVKAMSRQLAVYTGLFFALFVGVGQNGDDKKPLPPNPSPYVTQISQILDVKLEPIINVKDSLERVSNALILVGARSGLVVYLDKSPGSAKSDETKPDRHQSEQIKFHLSYVVLFDNASFESDRKVGRTVSPAEDIRLRKFASSLREIAETLRDADHEAGRLRIEVRGFASDAPKNWSAKEKDEKNNEVANDRARSVYDVLCAALKNVAVDLPQPVAWEKSGLEMHKQRQFNDDSVQRPRPEQTSLAEAPNRRVEILVTLPPGLRVRGVSDDITRDVTQR